VVSVAAPSEIGLPPTRTMAAPTLASGAPSRSRRAGSAYQAVPFIAPIDRVSPSADSVIELLQYRDRTQPQGSGNSFAPPQAFTSPAFPKSMHVCFYVREDVDFNEFVRDLEAEAARRGMHNVKANRIVASNSEQDRRQAPLDMLTNRITSGKSDGWSLIYAKGPEGEQLEFVQVRGQAKRVFGEALQARGRAVAATRFQE